MQRPPGLTITTWLIGIMNVLGFFLVDWQFSDAGVLFAVAIAVVLGAIVLWWYWKGLSWARWIVLLESFWCLWSLKYLAHATPVEVLMVVIEALLAVFFLVYLNTKPVRAWFQGTQ